MRSRRLGRSCRAGPVVDCRSRPSAGAPALVYPCASHVVHPHATRSGSRFRTLRPSPTSPPRSTASWRSGTSAQTFERLRAQNAGRSTWSFLDGPITANNPMGVHHAWGRTYKDLYQRFHAMLGEDQRWQNGFDCQGLWVEVNVERELGYTSKRDIERQRHRRLREPVQAARPDLRRDPDRAVDPARHVDGLERPRRAAPAARPARRRTRTQVVTVEGPHGPVTDTVEMIVGRLGMPELGGSYFTFCNENNDLIWGFLAECHKRGWLYKGHDSMPWCARCGTGISQMEMNEGYAGPRGPRADRAPPARRPAGRVTCWSGRRRPGRSPPTWRRPWARSCAYVLVRAGRRPLLARQGHAQDGAPGSVRGARGAPGRGPGRLALPRAVRRAARGQVGVRGRRLERPATSTASSPGTRSARTRARASSTSRPAAAPRTTSWARRSACRSSRRSTRPATTVDGLRLADRARRPGCRAAHRRGPRGEGVLLPPRALQPPLPALLALRHAAAVPGRRRVVHLHGPGVRHAAR